MQQPQLVWRPWHHGASAVVEVGPPVRSGQAATVKKLQLGLVLRWRQPQLPRHGRYRRQLAGAAAPLCTFHGGLALPPVALSQQLHSGPSAIPMWFVGAPALVGWQRQLVWAQLRLAQRGRLGQQQLVWVLLMAAVCRQMLDAIAGRGGAGGAGGSQQQQGVGGWHAIGRCVGAPLPHRAEQARVLHRDSIVCQGLLSCCAEQGVRPRRG